jgi:thiol-disulfide isomerase/thioredoxin
MKPHSYSFTALFLGVIFLCQIANASTTDPRMLLKRVQDKLKNVKSISYDIKYHSKCFDCDDTDIFEAHVDLLRVPEDTLAGVYLFANYKKGFSKLYDGKNIYFINSKDTSVTVTDMGVYPRDPTQGNFNDKVFSRSFIDPSRLDYDSLVEIILLHDSIIEDNKRIMNVLTIKKPPEDDFEYSPMYFVFDPSLNFSVYTKRVAKWTSQNKYQYDEVEFLNVEFDKVDGNYFKNFKMPDGYKIINYEPKKKVTEKLLDSNTLAPDFTAKNFPDTARTMKLSDYRGKIVVLDFWYMSCYPCVQALPALEEINKKYGSKNVVVLGVNSTDLRVKRIHKLPEFFLHNPITYSTILPDRSVDDAYHVSGYPSMYIIDKEGKIALSQVGYGPGMEKNITDKLDEMLK